MAVDEDENLVPLPAHAVKVRIMFNQQVLDLVTDADGYSPATDVDITVGPTGVSREPNCLYMCENAGIGETVMKSLVGPGL